MDVDALQNLGFKAAGWDPILHRQAPKMPAVVVNLGYGLNVIEEHAQRAAALQEAYSLAERILLVSTLVAGQETQAHCRPYRDRFLTKSNTFLAKAIV